LQINAIISSYMSKPTNIECSNTHSTTEQTPKMTVPTWRELAAEKRARQANQIPEAWRISPSLLENVSPESRDSVLDVPRRSGLLTAEELNITERYDAVDLVQKLAKQEVSAYAVTLAFCKRAAIAQQVVSSISHLCRHHR
jgi:amidase